MSTNGSDPEEDESETPTQRPEEPTPAVDLRAEIEVRYRQALQEFHELRQEHRLMADKLDASIDDIRTLGNRLAGVADSQLLLGEDIRRELGHLGSMQMRTWESVGALATSLDQHKTETVERIATVESTSREAAAQTDRNVEKVRGRLDDTISLVNRMHPQERDIAPVTGVYSIEELVDARITQRRYESDHAKLKQVEEAKRFWTRQVLLWVVGGMGAVMLLLVGALVTMVLHR